MRSVTKNIITADEAESLISGRLPAISVVGHSVLDKIKAAVEEVVGAVSWRSPSYALIGGRKTGHDWHCDIGAEDKPGFQDIRWCRWGCSILLRDRGDVGYIEYRDGSKIHNYLDLVIHSSDVEHRVPASEDRVVFLCFIA
jgi:hypothetical protein